MTNFCRCCGQPLRERQHGLNEAQLYELLLNGSPHREVYRTRDNSWHVTYGGGPTQDAAVRSLVAKGKIQSVYNNCPDSGYHIGKTLDMARTTEARRQKGIRNLLVYVGD